LVTPVLVWLLLRWALSKTDPEETPTLGIKIFRWIAILLAILLTIIFFVSFQNTALLLGSYLKPRLGSFSFLGNFIYQVGDLTQILVPLVIALGTSAVFGSLGGRAGAKIADKMSPAAGKLLNFPLAAIAGAELFAILGAGIDWLYQFENLTLTLWIPAGVGAVLGLVAASLVDSTTPLPSGMVIYYVIRTILNGIRSVEPLIMVIVFVVWVGIGPFAGALALGLHTIAALAKLFSEQVESILPGPLEAIRATGANRLQTIVYAVVPQIVPPYISFTMYRWDINVRMSTIIGWAGGGGIGFLLSQNIRLLNYRDASVQMIAIAVVVASMDYISSTLRERFV
jgi:phosphonate ABC transporter permease subunit PhnE